MIVAKFAGSSSTTAYGLTQWDYGQELALECPELEIPDGTEINFYQGKLSSIAYLKSNHVLVPDLMLQESDAITAYVYVRSPTSGETLLSICMPIKKRPRPDNYVLPEYKEYLRLLPPEGETGQVLSKVTDDDYDVGWANVDEDMEELTDAEVDEIFK